MKLRTMASTVAVSALLLTTAACGSDDENTDDRSKDDRTEQTDEPGGLTEDDLEQALLQVEDLEEIADGFREERDGDDEGWSEDDLVDGPQACADFLTRDYGADEIHKVGTSYAVTDDENDIAIRTTLEAYEEGEAADELEAVREIFAECSSFTVDFDGTPIDVQARMTELEDLGSDYTVGEEGLAVALMFTHEGQTVTEQGYTLVRIGDVLTISGATSPDGLGDPIMVPITQAAADRLEELLDEVA